MIEIRFSNPQLQADFNDWPSGRARVLCRFTVQSDPKRGERVARTTTGRHGSWCAAKHTTYSDQFRIVDGSDGRTYLLARRLPLLGYAAAITIWLSDAQHVVDTVYGDDPRYPALVSLFTAGAA